MTGASHHRGESKQDYRTPPEFLSAFERRFGPIVWDLAANKRNAVCNRWLGPGSSVAEDSLSVDWHSLICPNGSWLWLNPPYSNIRPWAEKCWREREFGARIALLVPASVGSNWWLDWVHLKSQVHLLRGRLSFDGRHPFPKDCALCLYGKDARYQEWDWRRKMV